jgi:hypothetical protein
MQSCVSSGQPIRVKQPRLPRVRSRDILRRAPGFFFGCIVRWGQLIGAAIDARSRDLHAPTHQLAHQSACSGSHGCFRRHTIGGSAPPTMHAVVHHILADDECGWVQVSYGASLNKYWE